MTCAELWPWFSYDGYRVRMLSGANKICLLTVAITVYRPVPGGDQVAQADLKNIMSWTCENRFFRSRGLTELG